MKRVLVISYFYPPYSSVGATRVSKMTRYLRDAGWDVHVLTVDRCDLPPTLPVELPEDAITRVPQIFDIASIPRAVVGRRRLSTDRVLAVQPTRWAMLWRLGEAYRHLACFPDGQIGWYFGAVASGSTLARTLRPDAIVSSSLPNTSHLIARAIARKTGIRWVAELRDLWTGNHNFQRIQPLRVLEEQLERSVLSEADAIVTVSEVWADWLRERYGRPTFVVPNGYDPTDYPTGVEPRTDVFTLVYTGMFYNGKQNPDPLFAAIRSLADAGRIRPETFRVQFAGQYLGPIASRAETSGVSRFIDVHPPVSYADSLRRQCAANALLFLDWFDGRARGWYSAKIYEYLGAGRPILSIGPQDSVVAQLLCGTRAGAVASNARDVELLLDRWLGELARCGRLAYAADQAVRERFQRQEAARRMGEVLDLTAGTAPGAARLSPA